MSTNHVSRSDEDATFDLDGYVPFYLCVLANRWTSTSSKDYLRTFGVGVVEWRILVSLAALKQARARDVCDLIAVDAGAVSRAMANLEKRRLIAAVEGRFPGRARPVALTDAGVALFARMKAVALAREARLLDPLTADEHRVLIGLLAKLHGTLPSLT